MEVFVKVILPVFLVVGTGYLSVWHKWLNAKNIDSLTTFAQNFAIPCLLFYAIAKIEMGEYFNFWLLVSFYISALACFIIGFINLNNMGVEAAAAVATTAIAAVVLICDVVGRYFSTGDVNS